MIQLNIDNDQYQEILMTLASARGVLEYHNDLEENKVDPEIIASIKNVLNTLIGSKIG